MEKNTGLKLGILSCVFCETFLVGIILGIVGLVKGIKSKAKLSITLNIIGIILSIAALIFAIVTISKFIQSVESLVSLA